MRKFSNSPAGPTRAICLDNGRDFQAETRNAALALCKAVSAQRAGKLVAPGQKLPEPRPK